MSRAVTTASPETDNELGNQLFWLARLDESRPRASLSPDQAQSTTADRNYNEVRFAVEADVASALKSVDPSRGVSDVAVCAATLAIVISKYQREDELVAGYITAGTERPVVLPVLLASDGNVSYLEVVQRLDAELVATSKRSAQFLDQAAQILGSESNLELGFAVGMAGGAPDVGELALDVVVLFDLDGGRINGRVVYRQDMFRRDRIQAFARHLERSATAAARQPSIPIKDLVAVTDEEQWKVVHHFNERTARFPLALPLHSLFELQSSKTPDAIAAIHNGKGVTYKELDRRANQIANSLLHAVGLQHGAFVGVLLNRSVDFLAAMLGVMKAGGAYIPLDPTYPEDRIRYMITDSEAAVIISDSNLISAYADSIRGAEQCRKAISMSGGAALPESLHGHVELVGVEDLCKQSDKSPGVVVRARDRAYMIYTSGSTGFPKGAICRHDGAVNHLYGELNGVGIHTAFRFLQSAASSSDISVWQFLAPLYFGGATVIADYETVVDPGQLFDLLKREEVDLAEPVPVVLRGLLDYIETLPQSDRVLPALRCMMVTGEALPVELANRWLALYPDIPVANTYGPTETSDDVTQYVAYEPLNANRATVPIGAPLPNVTIFIVDRYMRVVPVGVPGEICVAGIAVGEGYWKRESNTKAAFVDSPYPDKAPGPIYRTGDLGRWLPDGVVEFLGRIDQQVKVRGFRVEPGEIEAAITRHPAVQDAAVVAVDGGNGLRLIGYYVLRAGSEITSADLRAHLKGALAEHMVPSTLVPLQALPTTPMGKIDRKALERADYRQSRDATSYVAPQTPTEALLARIWEDVLRRDKVSAEDNFFEVGGDSILTMRVVGELRRAGIRVAPRLLFLHPCLSELARWIDEHPSVRAEPAKGTELSQEPSASTDKAHWRAVLGEAFNSLEDVYPLCGTQRGIYYQSLLLRRNSGAYVEQINFDIEGDVDPKLFAAAWDHVSRHTPVLRTAIIRRRTPQPVQVVLSECPFTLQVEDFRQLPAAERDAKFEAEKAHDRLRGYDLAKPPLSRGLLVRLDERRWRFLWSYHHSILDGWSEPLVLGDVMSAYGALAAGKTPAASQQVPFRNFVDWSEAQPLAPAEAYWRKQLSGFVSPVSIADVSPAVTPPAPTELMHGLHDATVSPDDLKRFNEACHRDRITFSTLVHGAWALVLSNRCSTDDVLFGSVASGRQCDVPGVETIRGLLVVTQPLRVQLTPDQTFGAWLRLLQLQMAEMREHEHTPLASIQQWSDVPQEKRPLFDTLVDVGNYQNIDLSDSKIDQFTVSRVRYSTQPLYPLTLFVVGGDEPSIQVIFDRRRYAEETVSEIGQQLLRYMFAFSENSGQRLAGLMDKRTPGS